MPRRQKAVGPIDRAARRKTAGVGNDHERRQLVGLRSQAIGEPGAEGRKPVEPKAGVFLKRGRRVIRSLGEHRIDHGQLVGSLGDVGKQFRNPQPATAATLELPIVLPQQAHLAKKHIRLLGTRQRLAVIFGERRLVVEGIDVAQRAAQANVYHPLGFCRQMRRQIGRLARQRRRHNAAFAQQQTGQRRAAQPRAHPGEKVAPSKGRRQIATRLATRHTETRCC